MSTEYPGVVYRITQRIGRPGKERVYYARYKVDGKLIETKLGRQFADDLTPAKAARLRGDLIEGRVETRKEKRIREAAEKDAAEGTWTVDRLATSYFENRREGKAKDVDRSRYNKFLKAAFGAKEPSEIIKLDTDRLRIKLLKKLKPQTVKHVLNLLIWIVNYGHKSGLSPALSFKVQKPPVNNLVTEDLTVDELQRLIKAINAESDVQIANFMRMALYTGMRRGELFKLKWKHVDFERGFISIVDPKGGPSQNIPLNDAARAILKDHPRTEGSSYVFPGRGGKRRVTVQAAANRVKKAAELPKNFRPLHGLRHAYASMLASSGEVDLYTLQKLLTHKSPLMTQRYAHLRDEALKRASAKAVAVINDALTKADENQKAK